MLRFCLGSIKQSVCMDARTFHWHVLCISLCVSQLIFLFLLRFILFFYTRVFLQYKQIVKTECSSFVLNNVETLNIITLTRVCEKFCSFPSSLIHILVVSLPSASFLIPLLMSPETTLCYSDWHLSTDNWLNHPVVGASNITLDHSISSFVTGSPVVQWLNGLKLYC